MCHCLHQFSRSIADWWVFNAISCCRNDVDTHGSHVLVFHSDSSRVMREILNALSFALSHLLGKAFRLDNRYFPFSLSWYKFLTRGFKPESSLFCGTSIDNQRCLSLVQKRLKTKTSIEHCFPSVLFIPFQAIFIYHYRIGSGFLVWSCLLLEVVETRYMAPLAWIHRKIWRGAFRILSEIFSTKKHFYMC